MAKNYYACPNCKSTRVVCQVWADINTQEPIEDTERYHWCNACEEDGNDGELEYDACIELPWAETRESLAGEEEPGSEPEPIVLVVFADPAAWLREHLNDMAADSVCAIRRIAFDSRSLTATYVDTEESPNQQIAVDETGHITALASLCQTIAANKWHVGGINNPLDLVDPSNWDAEVIDAYRQLAALGEIVYG